ncbi:MAG: hypothetical protein M3R43_02095 [Acidobacteriota bacterium]|nr:hypothetical protein [Acidobacteriota bacterium]
MPDTDTKSWTFLKGVGGVTGAVLTAVLIYYFTRTTPPPPPPPTIPSVAVNGFVADSATNRLLHNAVVTVGLGPNTVHQSTDTSGRYSVVLAPTSPNPDMGTVAIQAEGYKPFSNSVTLKPGDNYAEITLEALAPPVGAAVPPTSADPVSPAPSPSPTNPTDTAVRHPRAGIFLKQPPPNYVKKEIAEYAGIRRPHEH